MTEQNRNIHNTSSVGLRRGRTLVTLARLAVTAFLMVLAPAILNAHAKLLRSEPSAGQRLAASPSSVRLVFSETPMVAISRLVLMGPSGDTVRLGPVHVDAADAHAMLAEVAIPLDSGTYSVHWSTAASDGHASHGSFTFVVNGRLRQTSPAPVQTSVGTSGGESVSVSPTPPAAGQTERDSTADAVAQSEPIIVARWLGFLALFSLIGAVAFKYLVLGRISRPGQPDDPFDLIASTGAATFGMFAAVALVITTLVKLYGETLSMSTFPVSTILFHTGWGWAWIAQIAAALIAIIAFRMAHTQGNTGWSLGAICAIVVTATPSLTGHAIGSDNVLINVPLDVLHVLAGSVWLGTLAVILIVGIGAALKTPGTVGAGARVASMVNAFSPIALTCGATLVTSGVIVSLLRLHPLSTLWTSGYGRVLILKLGLVGLLFVVGAWNWRRVKPTLGGDAGLAALRKSARLELMAGAMVLAVTTILVALALPD